MSPAYRQELLDFMNFTGESKNSKTYKIFNKPSQECKQREKKQEKVRKK